MVDKPWELECEIFIHYDRKQWQIMRELAVALKVEAKVNGSFSTSDYHLGIIRNEAGYGPSDYRENDERSFFFDYFLSYRPIIPEDCQLSFEELQKIHAGHIATILNYFWENKVPAATYCFYDNLLPLRGGNDEVKVFWKDTMKVKRPEL